MTINEFAIKHGGDYAYKYEKTWNGYTVYGLCYNKRITVGKPRFILVKDGKMRLSEPEECFKIMDAVIDE